MIAIIAGNYKEAKFWASGQNLEDHEWFFPNDESDLYRRKNFHVIVIGTAGENIPVGLFEKIYQLAKSRGAMKS